MFQKIFLALLIIFLQNCSKDKDIEYQPKEVTNAFEVYQEAYDAFENGDYFYANKKFSEAELNFSSIEYAAKSAIMSSYALYGINFFLKKYSNSEYAIDLKFKKDLIQNQLAAKEMYVARYYIDVQKWVPAINRLKSVVKDYQETIFIEEALHRLVEIYYYIGLEEEAKKYANILGYNYNSSAWFEKSYKVTSSLL